MAKTLLLDTDTVTFSELLGNGNTYRVPPFQRDYSWRIEQWSDLWADILLCHADPNYRHYLGAVVLQAKDERDYPIVDGQQRIATLSIIAIAVIRTLDELADAGVDSDANRERSTILRRTFLGDKDPRSLTYSSKLFLNRANDGFYQDYLAQLRDPPNPRALKAADRSLYDAFQYFYRKIQEMPLVAKDGAQLAEFLSSLVAGRLLFIRITVVDQLNAYTVFETLNARGSELTPTDLIKNYLFSTVHTDLDFHRLERYWDRVIQSVETGRFPEFLRYFLSMEMPKVRREGLFRITRERVKSAKDAFSLLEDLQKYSDLFVALSDSGSDLWRDDKEAAQLIRELSLFRVRQIYPVLFAAYRAFERVDFVRLLRLVVTVSFRFNIVSSLNTNELEDAYNKAAIGIARGEIRTPAQAFQAMRSVYVDDEKFRSDFTYLSFATSGPRKKLVRYILYSLEADESKAQRDFELDSGTVEHILPENPTEDWKDSFSRDQADKFIYRLGNLTLLEDSLNRRAGTLSFEEKKQLYAGSSYAITNHLAPGSWTPEVVTARQAALAERAVHIWRSGFE